MESYGLENKLGWIGRAEEVGFLPITDKKLGWPFNASVSLPLLLRATYTAADRAWQFSDLAGLNYRSLPREAVGRRYPDKGRRARRPCCPGRRTPLEPDHAPADSRAARTR